MTIFLAILALVAVALLVLVLIMNKALENKVAAGNQEAERLRQLCETETLRIQTEAQESVSQAQKHLDQQYRVDSN